MQVSVINICNRYVHWTYNSTQIMHRQYTIYIQIIYKYYTVNLGYIYIYYESFNYIEIIQDIQNYIELYGIILQNKQINFIHRLLLHTI